MSNIISASLDALAQGASYAPALVFIAGLATSFGPCSAPRLITIVSCSALSRKAGALVVLVFVSGLTTAYASLGWIFGALGRVGDIASFTYAILATSLAGL